MNLFSLTPIGILESRAKEMIATLFPDLTEKLEYEVVPYIPLKATELAKKTNGFADGAYEDGIIYLHEKSRIKTVIHEFGHAVHYQLFETKEFSFSLQNKSDQAHLNFKEDFAEAFADLIINYCSGNDLSERDNQMMELIAG